MNRRALVLGGTGYVGQEVLRLLARRQVPAVFTYCRSHDLAQSLAGELGQRAVRADFTDPHAVARLFDEASPAIGAPDVLIHCAAVADARALDEITLEEWERIQAVNVRSALLACQAFARRLAGEGDVVLTAALSAIRPVASPAHHAASQGALVGLTRALAKELGPRGVRVNLVVAGVLDGGLSRDIEPRLRGDFTHFAALRRAGNATEVARAIARIALDNRYMSGAVLPLLGGL